MKASPRDWITAAILFVVVSAVLLVPVYIQSQVDRVQLEVTCATVKANILELSAVNRNGVILTRIARELGLPVSFPPPIEVPEVPPECEPS